MQLFQAQVPVPNNSGFLPEVQDPLDQHVELHDQQQPLKPGVLSQMVGQS